MRNRRHSNSWPFRDLPATHPAFVAINRLAARGMLPQHPTDVDFKPDSPATPEWRTAIVEASRKNIAVETLPEVSNAKMTRGEFCNVWWDVVPRVAVGSVSPADIE